MVGQYLPNTNKSATVAQPKKFHQLNTPLVKETEDGLCEEPAQVDPA